MAITGYMEYTVGQSEIFQGLNNSADGGQNTTQKALNLIKTAKRLTNEDIEAAYISVKQITDTLTKAALKAFDDGTVVLLYNNVPALSVSQSLPFLPFKNPSTGKFTTYVFVDKYITITKDGVMNMQAPILRDLLIGATICNGLKTNYVKMASNQYLQNVMMDVYTKMFTRILNRQFAIAADKIVFDIVQYWINRFFLNNVFRSVDTPENIETMASKHFKYIDNIRYNEIKQQYDAANPATISALMELLKPITPRMKALTMSSFLSDWISYYYIPSMLAIECPEYLIFMMITLLSGNNIISIAASDIVKDAKNIKSFRGELLKLI